MLTCVACDVCVVCYMYPGSAAVVCEYTPPGTCVHTGTAYHMYMTCNCMCTGTFSLAVVPLAFKVLLPESIPLATSGSVRGRFYLIL